MPKCPRDAGNGAPTRGVMKGAGHATNLSQESARVLRFSLQALKVTAVAALALLTVFFSQRLFLHYLDRTAATGATPVLFTVEPDESADSVAARLQAAGLIRSTLYFKAKMRLRGSDSKLKAGKYTLRTGMSVDEILDTITVATNSAGSPVAGQYVEFRIQEGWRTEQIAQLLVDKGLIKSKDEFYAAMNDPSLNRFDFLDSRPSWATLEGFLFPDTYRAPPNTPAKDLLELMLQDFGGRVPLATRQNPPAGYNFYQVLIIASIVEREAAVDEERPIIASVYYNRLKQNPPLPLEADPTVQYAIGQEPNWWPQLQPQDLKRESRYNTYLHPGLPPGPICNPSLKSIQAALNPAQTDYLYFVAKGDGTHAFARTYEEHLANIRKYQQR